MLVAAIAGTGCAAQGSSTLPLLSPVTSTANTARLHDSSTRGSGSGSSSSPSSLVSTLAKQIASKQLADGAILNSSSGINGYFANYAAMGLVIGGNYSGAQRWAQWYLAHVNANNVWGPGCSIYDYQLVGGVETSTGSASSVDAHSASFITLLHTMYRSGDSSLVSYVRGVRSQAECVAWSMVSLISPANNLAQVKPGDDIEYLIDNAQVYRGLGDMAWLEENAWSNPTESATYTNYQNTVAQGINGLWNPALNMYASYTTVLNHIETPAWNTWYADSTGQLFLVINGVLSPTNPRAVALYNSFNASWPKWTSGASANGSGFPWAVVAQAAAAMGDTSRVKTFASNAQATYSSSNWGWPWYDYESSGLIRALAAPTFSN
jgi:hypothetical protein